MADLLTYIRRLRTIGAKLDAALTDKELLERFVSQRDQAAFELLVWRHGPMVIRLCRRTLGHQQDIEDAFQAVFLILLHKAGSIAQRASLGGWLYKVAYRVALRARADFIKRRARERPGLGTVLDESPEHRAGDDLRPIPDELINGLSEKYRTPIVLCYFQGKTHREAAAQLGCAEGTVACRLSRARRLLRSRLERSGFVLPAGSWGAFASPHFLDPLPHRLVQLCMRMAAARHSGMGHIVRVSALAEGMMRTMFWSKTKIACAGLLVLVFTGSGAYSLVRGARQDDALQVTSGSQTTKREQSPPATPIKTERSTEPKAPDDPLAVLRFRTQSLNNLRQIGLALINYGESYKSLPPHGTQSKDGKPLLSWRVLILPYLEEEALYKQFNLDEPWDGPHNKQLLSKMPRAYGSPGKPASAPNATFYQVFVGKGAGFEAGQRLRLPDQFPDGCHQTLAVVEAGGPVPWTKPDDVPYAADQPLPRLGGLFDGIFNGVVFDGSVMTFKKNADPKLLRAAITRNGGEEFDISLIHASLQTGIKLNAAEIEGINRNLLRQWERARAELAKLTTVEPPRGSQEYSDPEMVLLRREHDCLQHLIEATRARIDAAKAGKKDQ